MILGGCVSYVLQRDVEARDGCVEEYVVFVLWVEGFRMGLAGWLLGVRVLSVDVSERCPGGGV